MSCKDRRTLLYVVIFWLQVLSVAELFPPNIEYSYVLNVESRFVWSGEGPWGPCNSTCQGQITPIYDLMQSY